MVSIDSLSHHCPMLQTYDFLEIADFFSLDLQFFKHNGEPFCAECYENKAPKCHNCGKAILEKTYSAMNKTYHLECFVCEVCGKGFDQGAFVPHDNKPYHQECFRAKFGKKCWICNEDITGEYYELEGAVI